MKVSDIASTNTLIATLTEAASNKIPYAGLAFFPADKKEGIDISQIRTAKGLPVTLNPSAPDTVSAIRSRKGFKLDKTQMAFFKESMLVKEEDRYELARISDVADPYLKDVYKNIYNDFETLYESADVVPERMRMQLLSSDGGHPSIYLAGDGATYAYNYDPNNEYSASNYEALSGNNLWTAHSTANPIADIKRWKKATRKSCGEDPAYILMDDATFNEAAQCTKIADYVKAAVNEVNVVIDDDIVKRVIEANTKMTLIVYDKQFIDESGDAAYFYPEGFVALLPAGAVGKTWYGVTAEELAKREGENIDVAVVDNKVAVSVIHSLDPVQDKTVVSEVLLPSFEKMMYTYTAKVYTPS